MSQGRAGSEGSSTSQWRQAPARKCSPCRPPSAWQPHWWRHSSLCCPSAPQAALPIGKKAWQGPQKLWASDLHRPTRKAAGALPCPPPPELCSAAAPSGCPQPYTTTTTPAELLNNQTRTQNLTLTPPATKTSRKNSHLTSHPTNMETCGWKLCAWCIRKHVKRK